MVAVGRGALGRGHAGADDAPRGARGGRRRRRFATLSGPARVARVPAYEHDALLRTNGHLQGGGWALTGGRAGAAAGRKSKVEKRRARKATKRAAQRLYQLQSLQKLRARAARLQAQLAELQSENGSKDPESAAAAREQKDLRTELKAPPRPAPRPSPSAPAPRPDLRCGGRPGSGG